MKISHIKKYLEGCVNIKTKRNILKEYYQVKAPKPMVWRFFFCNNRQIIVKLQSHNMV